MWIKNNLIRAVFFLAPCLLVAQSPKLAAFQRSECVSSCDAPQWIFEDNYSKGSYRFSFGLSKGCNDGDTLLLSKSGDTLVLKVKTITKPRIRTRNGKTDTVYTADEYDCECFYRYEVKIDSLGFKPCNIKVNNRLFDWRYGFIKPGSDGKIRAYLDSLSIKYHFALGAAQETFIDFKPNSYLLSDENAWHALSVFLKYRQTAKLEFKIVLSAEERARPDHHQFLTERAEYFIRTLYRKHDVCGTRLKYKGELRSAEKQTQAKGHLWIRLVDAGSPLFPEYEKKQVKNK